MTKQAGISMGIVTAVVLAAGYGMYFWMTLEPVLPVGVRYADVEAEIDAGTWGNKSGGGEDVNIEGTFKMFEGEAAGESQSWSNFRGEDFSNVVKNSVPLANSWPEGGPPVMWKVKLGEGHGGAAVLDGRVYILDYDEEEKGDALRVFSLKTGEEIWRRWYKAPTKRNHGVSRTVPAVTEKYTVTIGPRCYTMCVDTETGEYRWGIDMVADYGTDVPLWYTGQNPIIDNGVAVLAPGGTALMMGVDCETGEVVWETPNPDKWRMSHSSIIPMTLHGKRTYVYCTMGGVVGVSAEPEDLGTLLWKSNEWSGSVISPSPVQIDESRIFLTAGYGTGSMMMEVKKEGDAFSAAPIYALSVKEFGCEQQTPIFYKENIFAIMPKDAAALRGQFVCMNPDGKLVWTSGQTERYGLGPFLIADDKIFILNDNGIMTLINASLEGFTKLAESRVVPGHDAWGPMALVDGLLLLRDSKYMLCLDVRAH